MSKFKIGDKVHHYRYGRGTIKAYKDGALPYFVEFDNKHDDLHNGGYNGIYGKERSCYWVGVAELTMVSKAFKGNK